MIIMMRLLRMDTRSDAIVRSVLRSTMSGAVSTRMRVILRASVVATLSVR